MNEQTLLSIINSDETSLRDLARYAGVHVRDFYRGSDFSGLDMRGEDMRNFNLTGVNFHGAQFDHTTLVNDEFAYLLGRENEVVTAPRQIGFVKWYNMTKGYGFLQPSGGGADIFLHVTAVERAGISEIYEGDILRYELEANKGKTFAVNLQLIFLNEYSIMYFSPSGMSMLYEKTSRLPWLDYTENNDAIVTNFGPDRVEEGEN